MLMSYVVGHVSLEALNIPAASHCQHRGDTFAVCCPPIVLCAACLHQHCKTHVFASVSMASTVQRNACKLTQQQASQLKLADVASPYEAKRLPCRSTDTAPQSVLNACRLRTLLNRSSAGFHAQCSHPKKLCRSWRRAVLSSLQEAVVL